MSLNAIATPAAREPGPLVTRWRSLTVAKVDAIGWWCAGGSSARRGSRGRPAARRGVVGDLSGRLGPLGAVVGGEHVGRGLGVVLVLGVPDLGERLLRARLGGLGQRVEHVADLVPPAPLLAGLGNTSRTADQNPRAPSPTASSGAAMPRRLQPRSRSSHDSIDSRCPSSSAMSSLVPSARTPIITSRHTLSCSSRTLRWIPSTQQ